MSAASSVSSSASACELETHNWDAIATQSPVASSRGGGGKPDPVTKVIYGENVVFVPTPAAARICGANIGSNSGKKCLLLKNEEDKCSVATHNTQGPDRAIQPGFYLRAGPSARDRDYILEEPIAGESLYVSYGDLIMGSTIRSSEFWVCATAALSVAPNLEAGISSFRTLEDAHSEVGRNMANLEPLPTLEQVVVKCEDVPEHIETSIPKLFEPFTTNPILPKGEEHQFVKRNFEKLTQHVEDVMTSMASTMKVPFREDASIKALLSFGFVESQRIELKSVDEETFDLQRGIMTANHEALNLRVNNLSKTVGEVNRAWEGYKKESKVPLYFEDLNAGSSWEVMLQLFTRGKRTAKQLTQVEKTSNKEFKGMFKAFSGLADKVENLKRRMNEADEERPGLKDPFESDVVSRSGQGGFQTSGYASQPRQLSFKDFMDDPDFLKWSLDFSQNFSLQVDEVKARFDSSDSMARAFPFESLVFRNHGDLQARMDMLDIKVPFGGFCCLFNVLYRVYVRTTSSDFEGELKKNKMIRESNSPKAEALSEYCLKTVIPTIFGTEQPASGKSDLSGLPTYAHWKKPKTRHGLFYQLSELLPVVKRECTSLINQAYPSGNRDQFFRRLAIDILHQSMNTIEALMRWIDETHEVLTGVGGNSNDASWFIITKIIRHLFERLYAPARLAPMGLDMNGKNEKGCLVLWAIIQTHMISEDLELRNIKDHPIVVGAYTEWIVANSGRREAEEVRALNIKLTAQVETLAKDLESTKKKLDSVKGSADRALLAVSKNK